MLKISGEALVSFGKARFGFLLYHMHIFAYVFVERKFLALLSEKIMDLQALLQMQFQLYHAVCPFHLRFQQAYQNDSMLYQILISRKVIRQ